MASRLIKATLVDELDHRRALYTFFKRAKRESFQFIVKLIGCLIYNVDPECLSALLVFIYLGQHPADCSFNLEE